MPICKLGILSTVTQEPASISSSYACPGCRIVKHNDYLGAGFRSIPEPQQVEAQDPLGKSRVMFLSQDWPPVQWILPLFLSMMYLEEDPVL